MSLPAESSPRSRTWPANLNDTSVSTIALPSPSSGPTATPLTASALIPFHMLQATTTLRWTAFTFEAGMAIRRVGRINDLQRPTFSQKIYGRGGSAVQMLIRIWDHKAADELLLEAYK